MSGRGESSPSAKSGGSKGAGNSAAQAKFDSVIEKYNLHMSKDGTNLMADNSIFNNPEDLAFVKSNKTSIITQIDEAAKAREKAKVEREAKIAAIEGLDELTRARSEWSNYSSDYSRFINRGGIGRSPQKPAVSVEELAAKYPRAAAYLKAQDYKFSSNHGKSTAGRKALEDIINGRDYNKVLKRMEREWSNYATEQLKYD